MKIATQRKIEVMVLVGQLIPNDPWLLLNDLNDMLDDVKSDIEAYEGCAFDRTKSVELEEFATWLESTISIVEEYYYNR